MKSRFSVALAVLLVSSSVLSAQSGGYVSFVKNFNTDFWDDNPGSTVEAIGISYDRAGDPSVYAFVPGTVVELAAESDPVFGLYAVCRFDDIYYIDGDGLYSIAYAFYAKMDSLADIHVGDQISIGQKLGSYGSFTGRLSRSGKAMFAVFSIGYDPHLTIQSYLNGGYAFPIPGNETFFAYNPNAFTIPGLLKHLNFQPADIDAYVENYYRLRDAEAAADDAPVNPDMQRFSIDIGDRLRVKTTFNGGILAVSPDDDPYLSNLIDGLYPNDIYRQITHKLVIPRDDYTLVYYLTDSLYNFAREELSPGTPVYYFINALGSHDNTRTYHFMLGDFLTMDFDAMVEYYAGLTISDFIYDGGE